MATDDTTTSRPASPDGRVTTPVIYVVLAWLIVVIPAAWGVGQTCMKSLALFRGSPGQPTTAPSVPIGPTTSPAK